MGNDTTVPELSTDIRLLPGEKLLNIVNHPPRIFRRPPSSMEQILRLTGSQAAEDIGQNRPSLASLSFVTEDDDTPSHLRLYEVIFGRDSLRVAIDLLHSYPALAKITVLKLAEMQGMEFNAAREEEPGRIVHEARNRDDPIARDLSERLGWDWPYYGSVDATPDFVRTLAAYCTASGGNPDFVFQHFTAKNGETRTIADALTAAVDWIIARLNSNPEGLLEFKSAIPQGIENQVWKDSWDAYHHSTGALANHDFGIASIEVQVTTYDALLDAADIYEVTLRKTAEAETLRKTAEQLRTAILSIFWCQEKGGYFVLGTDRDELGNLRILRVRTSNMGHALNSRLLESNDPQIVAMRESVVRQLLSPELLCTSGIRTLASDEVRFRSGSYHNGSVWLWDTHHIAKGMRRLGFKNEADDLDQRILNVVETTRIFPEYVRGDNSDTPSINTRTINIWDETYERINKLEQPPQEVQAWTVAAILATKKRLERRGRA